LRSGGRRGEYDLGDRPPIDPAICCETLASPSPMYGRAHLGVFEHFVPGPIAIEDRCSKFL
jgi:hypothetical protein